MELPAHRPHHSAVNYRHHRNRYWRKVLCKDNRRGKQEEEFLPRTNTKF